MSSRHLLSPIISLLCIPFICLGATPNVGKQGMFIPNHGQWPSTIHYMAKTPSMNLWITDKGITHDLYSVEKTMHGASLRKGHTFTMTLPGALLPKGIGITQSPTIVNYFLGNNPTLWKTNIPTYTSITIPQVYDGIDMVYSFDGANPRYD